MHEPANYGIADKHILIASAYRVCAVEAPVRAFSPAISVLRGCFMKHQREACVELTFSLPCSSSNA